MYSVCRVCIFVYLLTINFVCVLIIYFKNILYSCIIINFTISYVKIAHTHIYLINSMHVLTCKYSTVYTTYFCYLLLPVLMLFSLHFVYKNTDTVSYAIGDKNVLEYRKGQNPVIKIMLIINVICNFISIQSQTFWIFKNIIIFLEF